jgi:hypothetical protein
VAGLSLKKKKMRWPDWIPRPSNKLDAQSMEPEVELPPLTEGWPKRPQGLCMCLQPPREGPSPGCSVVGLAGRLQ